NYNFGLGGLLPWGMTYKLGATAANDQGTFNHFANQYSTFAGVTATQPLLRNFGFGSTLASIRIARTNRNISEWQLKQSVIDTVTNVIFAYMNLDFSRKSLTSARGSRDLAVQLVDENEKRFKVGQMSEYDVTSAKARVAAAEDNILTAEQSIKTAE